MRLGSRPTTIEVMSDVTRILSQIESGDPAAAEELLPLVYDELRKLAAAQLALEKPGQTLQATALVHEVFLRLVAGRGRESGVRRLGGQRAQTSRFSIAAGISLPRRRRRCGGFWWRMRARKKRLKHGGDRSARGAERSQSGSCRKCMKTWWRSMRRLIRLTAVDPQGREAGSSAVFCRTFGQPGGGAARHFAAHGGSRLGVCPGLVAPGDQRAGDRASDFGGGEGNPRQNRIFVA